MPSLFGKKKETKVDIKEKKELEDVTRRLDKVDVRVVLLSKSLDAIRGGR